MEEIGILLDWAARQMMHRGLQLQPDGNAAEAGGG
jgi:hypothetical protein